MAERHHGLYLRANEQGIQPAVTVRDDPGVVSVVLATLLAKDAVEEGVHHHVANLDAQFGEKPLRPLTSLTDEDAAGNRLVGSGVLAEHEHAGGTVETPA